MLSQGGRGASKIVNVTYRKRAIIGRSWLEVALEYKPYIRPKVTEHKCAETIPGQKYGKKGHGPSYFETALAKLQAFSVLHNLPGLSRQLKTH